MRGFRRQERVLGGRVGGCCVLSGGEKLYVGIEQRVSSVRYEGRCMFSTPPLSPPPRCPGPAVVQPVAAEARMCKVSARTQHEKTWTNSTGFEADMWYNILVAFRSHRPASCLLARACPLRGALAGPKRAGFRGASLLYGRGRGRLVGDQPARERVRPREGADGLLGRPGESSVHVVYNPSSKGFYRVLSCVCVCCCCWHRRH